MRDVVVHQAGNAEELARVLGAHLAGEPVATRGFEEREGPLRVLNDADLWGALADRMATLNEVAEAAEAIPADTDVAWTGRTMKVPWFAEHMREELVLHGWDITGDSDGGGAFQAGLAEPWMTTHSVLAVGRPLLVKGGQATATRRAGRSPAARRRHRRRGAGRRSGADQHRVRRAAGPGHPGNRRGRAGAAAVGAQARRPVTHPQPRRTAGPGTGALPARRLLNGFRRPGALRSCYR